MTSTLFSAVIVHTFGRNSLRPQKTAWRRLLFAIGIATMLDIIVTGSLSTLQLPSDLFQSWVAIMLILTIQIVVGLIMLIVRASGYGLHDDQINDILSVMPVSELSRWVIALVPGLVVVGLLYIVTIGPLIIIASTLHLPLYLCILSIIIGTLSGIGLGTYQPHTSIALNFLLMGLLVAAELQLLERIMTTYQIYQNPFLVGFATLLVLIVIPFYWLARSVQTWSHARQRKSTAVYSFSIFPIGVNTWLAHKVTRHPKIIRSAVVLTGISNLLTYMWLQSSNGGDPDMSIIIIGLSFIASLATSDIRGLTRSEAAPEIIMVRGSLFFVIQQICTGLILSTIVTAPIWLSLVISHSHHPTMLLAILGQLALGSTTALLTSTLFVPSQQDVSAEFFSATISACLIIALEKISTSLKLATTLQAKSIIWIITANIIAICIFSVERRRNNYYWKGINTYA